MKITLTQLFAATQAFEALAAEKFQPVTALKIARIGAKLTPERELAIKQRDELIKQHGEIDEKTGNYTLTDRAKIEAFNGEFGDLLKAEITVHIVPLPFQALDHLSITPANMQGLEPFLLIDKEPEKA